MTELERYELKQLRAHVHALTTPDLVPLEFHCLRCKAAFPALHEILRHCAERHPETRAANILWKTRARWELGEEAR